jgi:hypothetical protein
LTQTIVYRIDGIDEPGDAPAESDDARWSYVGSIGGVARFLDPSATAAMLELDRLIIVGNGHLAYKST